ncbi:hypothetical protein [Haloarcula pelagica]|uniref:hypothetical protein n=1 Tax=Haloarcula pelagica TaxID=3033389 RepID=UPI0024C368D1|nr:hypothetical protein [Halomicroarcula sp. YJ-61-S]
MSVQGGCPVTIPVDHLRAAGLGTQVELLSTAVAEYLDDDKTLDRVDSNVAIVSDPFAGRTALLEYAEELLGEQARRVTLSEVVTGEEPLPEIPTDRALLLADCHYLYRRCVGGFDVLDEFLERLAMTNQLVVTTWNRYSWRYLAAVRRVDQSFPLEIRLPPMDAEQIEAVVRAHVGDSLPTFVETGAAGRIKTVDVGRYPVDLWGDRTVRLPYVRPNPAWVASWWSDEDTQLQAVVYEKLRRVSHGNPGIATSLWDRSVRETEDGREIAPRYVRDPVADCTGLADETAYLLWHVVAMEGLDRDRLASMLDRERIDTAVQTLANMGVVDVAGREISLRPVGLHPAVAELTRRQLLW